MDIASEPMYDIDVSIGMLQAHAHQQMTQPRQTGTFRLPPSWMTREKTAKAQQIWDQLDEHSKTVILAPAEKCDTNSIHKIILHEISAYDYLLANVHSSSEHTSLEPHTQADMTISKISPLEKTEDNNRVLVNAAGSPNLPRTQQTYAKYCPTLCPTSCYCFKET